MSQPLLRALFAPSSRSYVPAVLLSLALGIQAAHAENSGGNAFVPAGNQQEAHWTINLKDADIREFIDQISEITGETFVVDPRVKGQVSVVSKAQLSLSEVYQLFLSVMSTHGFTVVAQGDQARIVPNAEAKTEAGGGQSAPDRLETRVIQVQQSPVSELIPLIRPLVPQYGHLAAVPSANALIISDRSANIARIEDVIRQLDQKGSHDYSVINLRYGWVMDAAEVLNNAMSRGQAKGAAGAQVIADARTNRLIILGPPQARAKLVQLAQSLDTPTARSANTRVIRLRHNDAKTLAETLGQISEGMKNNGGQGGEQTGGGRPSNILIRADESTNALILLADPDTVNALEDIVRQLDVPRAQVLVEAAIVEISGDIQDAVGVQWAINKGGMGGTRTNFGNTGLSIGTLLQALKDDKPPVLPDGAIVGIGSSSFGALVTALSANSKSNLLSTPSLLTLDNQKAEILVGQNVPFNTGSYTTNSEGSSNPFTTVERKDIGVNLKVTPHINDGAALRLEIEQEISSIAPSVQQVSNTDIITNKRSIKSTILAENGQVIVLGGLIQDDVVQAESKVPLLGDIPWLGKLFRSTKDTHTKRNLMVFLRPTVVLDGAGLAAISGKKYSDIRVLDGRRSPEGRGSILPSSAGQLFDGQTVDLRDLKAE
ncbi:TPA: GspD family T2SS secretin variant XcpQ [Pseudomonas aeruginosa]|uniref:Type II secretion system protein GspD n=5 Tax=Pseudomonas aeruginosa TaxID=287 RepID=A0A643IWP7_PSEAI|nr:MULTISPECIES: GspD family T2SS secretin variant XcpQ [Pseudomonas]KEA16726.1 general secretion pathway protein GspD [Pseudomonas aeruginosa C1913C]AHA16908.1 type II secretion system protein GspD [Pseudomonas aeruginosa PA1]AHA22707.1 General secretion pathway protein D [Pseudomonas aeruginosa PA1R]ALE47742.1 type II secretion system protein GspD [Pseudomonas aeruginosa]EKV4464655.1 GspD family T2SS secretin variant XcpQ [Pseudomonas aeruginosa]